jgi:hypothetical protein
MVQIFLPVHQEPSLQEVRKKKALRMPKNIFDVFKYLGYGIYVGRK